jgi:hypothetical protein
MKKSKQQLSTVMNNYEQSTEFNNNEDLSKSTNTVSTQQKLSDECLKFDEKQEFLNYYELNKNCIDNMKTRGLNTKFKIKGFKIARLKGKIMLIPLKNNFYFEENQSKINESNSEESEDILFRLKQLENRVYQISNFLAKAFPIK